LPAALWRRFAAAIYDLFPVLAIWFAIGFVATGLRGFRAVPPQTWWFNALLLGSAFAYFAWSWRRGGQTLGMRAWRLRLISDDGNTLNWSAALLRCVVAVFSIGLAGIGVFWALADPQRRTWHDLAARTRVVSA
jgi:uncharacterized RDD family membrane protein YckC